MTIKTAIGYEHKPPQCVDRCPFDDEAVNRAGVEFTPDCKGPAVIDSVVPPVVGRLEVDGDVATFYPGHRGTPPMGALACRGAWDWFGGRKEAATIK